MYRYVCLCCSFLVLALLSFDLLLLTHLLNFYFVFLPQLIDLLTENTTVEAVDSIKKILI